MRPQLTPLLLALMVLALAPPLEAGEMTVIKYHLAGTVQQVEPFVFTLPIYSPESPSPQRVQQPAGSMVTFRFSSAGGVPFESGEVTILTFVQSSGLTWPGLNTGYNRLELNSPITGGHLLGHTASGSASRTGSNNGVLHCTASPATCYFFFNFTYLASYRIGRGANSVSTSIEQILWTAYNPARPSFPVFFNGRATGAKGTLIYGDGWVFNSGFSALSANRPFCDNSPGFPRPPNSTICFRKTGTISLVGTEVGRTVIPAPEPTVLPLLAVSLVALLGMALVRRRASR